MPFLPTRFPEDPFFPRVPDPDALVIDFLQHGAVQRATLPLQ
jgi:hypothetical protein